MCSGWLFTIMQIVNNLVLTTRLPSHPVHTATAVYYSVSNVFRAATAFAAFPLWTDTENRAIWTKLYTSSLRHRMRSAVSETVEHGASVSPSVCPVDRQQLRRAAGMVWYGAVNVDLYSAIITKVSNALNTLVSWEKPGFQALRKGLIFLLCAEVVRQGVPDHRAVYSKCSASNSG